VLIDGFEHPPVILMAHTPRYYAGQLESAGYTCSKDLLAYWLPGHDTMDRLLRGIERIRARYGGTVRSLDMSRFEQEVALIQEIYNAAWERNWGFVPLTAAEIHHLASQFKPVIEPGLCLILEASDGEPVGFGLALPDYNRAMRHMNGRLFPFGFLKFLWYRRRAVTHCRMLTMGLKPAHRGKGLDAMIVLRTYQYAASRGWHGGECSWILEDNWEMRRGLERIGASVYKTYRVFEKQLAN
jgi:hypothetical protein